MVEYANSKAVMNIKHVVQTVNIVVETHVMKSPFWPRLYLIPMNVDLLISCMETTQK